MSRSLQKTGASILAEFVVYDSADSPVTGLSLGSFSSFLFVNGAASLQTVTFAEVGNGVYSASFTPNVSGTWCLVVRQATYNPRGWEDEYDVTADGNDPLAVTIDGYSVAQILELGGAVLAGAVTGGPTSPVFGAMNSPGTPRVAATCDSSGNRLSVTLTP